MGSEVEEGKKCERRPATRTRLQYNSCARPGAGCLADGWKICTRPPSRSHGPMSCLSHVICYANNINIYVRTEQIRYGPLRVADNVPSEQYDLCVRVHCAVCSHDARREKILNDDVFSAVRAYFTVAAWPIAEQRLFHFK